SLPAVVQPRAGTAARNLDALLTWCGSHRADVEALLHRAGAILFRGFDVLGPDDFARLARATTPHALVEYVAGRARRKKITDGVYTSTEYPPHVVMPSHNELCHTKDWISLIFFYCQVAPRARGETPLVDGRKVVRDLRPETAALFREKQVVYVRYLHCG